MNNKPLYKNDGTICAKLNKEQIHSLNLLKKAISDKKLILKENICLCKNTENLCDQIISEKDRYGLPIPQIACKKCGIIRSKYVFDEQSNNLFYEKYYRDLYTTPTPSSIFFEDQKKQGQKFVELLKEKNIFSEISNVAEIGCGAGGILAPFASNGKNVKGFDFNQTYLNYGLEKGLSLYKGDYDTLLDENSCDIIILSHVLEHFLNPIEELAKILKKIKPGKYLLVEVPGIYNIHNAYKNPILYFQNAHIYNFYEKILRNIFKAFHMNIIEGNEQCIFVCQKNIEYKQPTNLNINNLSDEHTKIYAYLLNCKKKYNSIPGILSRFHFYQIFIQTTYSIACIFGWKKIRKIIRWEKYHQKTGNSQW